MSGLTGTLCCDKKSLKKAANKRRREYQEVSVANSDVQQMEEKGWTVGTKHARTCRLRRQKTPDETFEDEVWLTFYQLGFSVMNEDRKCLLQFDSYSKQVDVLASDGENVFVIECKSSTGKGAVNARDALEKLVTHQGEIRKALEGAWGHDKVGRVCHLVIVSSAEKRQKDEDYVATAKGKNLFLWSRAELSYVRALAAHVGTCARSQLYSIIFADRKHKALKKPIPATRSRMGSTVCYSFFLPAGELMKYAYVHHRRLTTIREASLAYQRMLRSPKIKEISRYVDFEDGYFPNTIIVNFFKDLGWQASHKYDECEIGTVTLPPYYGCAWIIDGQHRLYGAASASKKLVLPVLAFHNMKQKEQAALFVEINKKQTSVPGNLLWDLYCDIYAESDDARQKRLHDISCTARILATSGVLRNCIHIESLPQTEGAPLTLTTVCSTIKNYLPWKHLLHPCESEKTPEHAASIINAYYQVLAELWPEDWERGGRGVLLSNNGFGVFIMVLNDIMRHLTYKEDERLFHLSDKSLLQRKFRSLLEPAIEYAKEEAADAIRKDTGRGPQRENAALVAIKINDFCPEFSPPSLAESRRQPSGVPLNLHRPSGTIVEDKAGAFEPMLRKIVLEHLQEAYGDKWWKQGIPGGLKSIADKKWTNDIKRNPYLVRPDANEAKFERFGLGEITDIVLYGTNWPEVFEQVFKSKEEFAANVGDIAHVRDPRAHGRANDIQDLLVGAAALRWFAQILGDRSLDPYA